MERRILLRLVLRREGDRLFGLRCAIISASFCVEDAVERRIVLRLVRRREGDRLCCRRCGILSLWSYFDASSTTGSVGVALASAMAYSCGSCCWCSSVAITTAAEVSFLFFLGFFGLDFLEEELFEKEAENTLR